MFFYIVALFSLTLHLSYPSGRVAICAINPGANITGRYTIVYGDSTDSPMLATFVPSGQGCCYHKNGSIRYVEYPLSNHLLSYL